MHTNGSQLLYYNGAHANFYKCFSMSFNVNNAYDPGLELNINISHFIELKYIYIFTLVQ